MNFDWLQVRLFCISLVETVEADVRVAVRGFYLVASPRILSLGPFIQPVHPRASLRVI
jgi:hypothetical protein